MSVWSDKLIRQALNPGDQLSPVAWVPDERLKWFGRMHDFQVQPASLDVRLGPDFIRHPSGELVFLEEGNEFALYPGDCVLATLVERFCIPTDVVARVEGKSTWARHFLTIHSAGFIDPGFTGDITLELKNDGGETLMLTPGCQIAQISFQWLAAPAERPYGTEGVESHYQGQRGPTAPWG